MSSDDSWRLNYRIPIGTGSAAALIGLGTLIGLGGISDWKGLQILQSTLPTIRFLCSALITSSATILALMLTILSLGTSSQVPLNRDFYGQIRRIARLDTVAFVGAVLFLLAISVPFSESEKVPTQWYDLIYYAVVGMSCALAGLVVAIVTMLYQAIDAAIVALGIGDHEHPLVAQQSSTEENGDAETAAPAE